MKKAFVLLTITFGLMVTALNAQYCPTCHSDYYYPTGSYVVPYHGYYGPQGAPRFGPRGGWRDDYFAGGSGYYGHDYYYAPRGGYYRFYDHGYGDWEEGPVSYCGEEGGQVCGQGCTQGQGCYQGCTQGCGQGSYQGCSQGCSQRGSQRSLLRNMNDYDSLDVSCIK